MVKKWVVRIVVEKEMRSFLPSKTTPDPIRTLFMLGFPPGQSLAEIISQSSCGGILDTIGPDTKDVFFALFDELDLSGEEAPQVGLDYSPQHGDIIHHHVPCR